MPKKNNKTTWNKMLMILILITIVIFAFVIVNLRNSLKYVSQDSSVVMLTNDASFKIVQLINRNKNTFEDTDCWNQLNPYIECSDENQITEGKYYFAHNDGRFWLKIQEDTPNKMTEETVRESLKGFMLIDREYFQTIQIKYSPDRTQIIATINTRNDFADFNTQDITLKKT